MDDEEKHRPTTSERRVAHRTKMRKKKAAMDRAQMITEVYGEQPFVPGVDPGLKIWILVREQLRAVESGDLQLPITYPTRIKYDNRWYWMEETHKEWREMIDECLEEKRAIEQKEIDEKVAEAKAIEEGEELKRFLEIKYVNETPDEKIIRLDIEKRENYENTLMSIEDEEIKIYYESIKKSMYDAYGDDYDYDYDTRPNTTTSIDSTRSEFDENGNKVRYHEDGTRYEDRGVYGIIPLLDPTLKKRTPGMKIVEFENFWKYSNNRQEVMLKAFNHFHWKYMDLILEAAGPGAQQLINLVINDKNQRTLLHLAVLQGDPERVEYLLAHGADPLIADHRGDTLLMLSFDHEVFIHYHDVSIAANLLKSRILKKSKANKRNILLVNKFNNRGVTPLHRAILLGALDYVELFLKNKAIVYIFDNDHKLPIEYCNHEWELDVKDLFNKNIRFAGKKMHHEMWAYIMSQKFVKSIFDIVAPICPLCKRKQYDCATLKKGNFRYWIYAHELAKRNNK